MKNINVYFFSVEEFDSWLTLLPEFLCQRKIPYHLVKSLSNIARYNIPQFTKSLSMLKPAILGNTTNNLYYIKVYLQNHVSFFFQIMLIL